MEPQADSSQSDADTKGIVELFCYKVMVSRYMQMEESLHNNFSALVVLDSGGVPGVAIAHLLPLHVSYWGVAI